MVLVLPVESEPPDGKYQRRIALGRGSETKQKLRSACMNLRSSSLMFLLIYPFLALPPCGKLVCQRGNDI